MIHYDPQGNHTCRAYRLYDTKLRKLSMEINCSICLEALSKKDQGNLYKTAQARLDQLKGEASKLTALMTRLTAQRAGYRNGPHLCQ